MSVEEAEAAVVLGESTVSCFCLASASCDGQIGRHSALLITGISVHLLITSCLNVPVMHVVHQTLMADHRARLGSARLPPAYHCSVAGQLIGAAGR